MADPETYTMPLHIHASVYSFVCLCVCTFVECQLTLAYFFFGGGERGDGGAVCSVNIESGPSLQYIFSDLFHSGKVPVNLMDFQV